MFVQTGAIFSRAFSQFRNEGEPSLLRRRQGVGLQQWSTTMKKIETGLALVAIIGAVAVGGSASQATPLSFSRQLDTAAAQGGTVEKTAYVFAGHDYCFYPDGWHGPGFYRCGFSWRRGFGWGGPVGWHGFRPGRGEIYAGRGHGYVEHRFGRERMEGRIGGPNGAAGVRGGSVQQNSQMNATGGRTVQNNAIGTRGRTLQNNAAGMRGGSTGNRGTMSPQGGGSMGAHGAGAGTGAHGGTAGSEH
jgi:hypothetical protein